MADTILCLLPAHTQAEDPPVLEETAAVLLKFANGVMALIDNTRRAPVYDERMEAFTKEGVVRFGYDPQNPETLHLTSDPFVRFSEGYRAEMDHMADLVRHRGIVAMEVTKEQCLDNSRIATALMESAGRGTMINMT